MEAIAVLNAVPVVASYRLDNVSFIETTCRDFDHYQTLPPAVTLQGKVYGLTGWNSDRCLAYYRTDAKVAYRA